MRIFKKYILFIGFVCAIATMQAQVRNKSALFLGNSYTYYNNMPQLTAQFAESMGDTLTVDSNTPGGYTFALHTTNATSLAKIAANPWHFVVLQEQSQLPSFPDAQVASQCFPYAAQLDSRIHAATPTAETVFYMTWGRKNGDASNCANFPTVCTYQGMDSLLNRRYRQMAADNRSLISPVGAVWHRLRDSATTIELYDPDGSHPSLAGSYAAACTFYTVFFRRNPALSNFNGGLDSTTAATIRNTTKTIVYDHLSEWNVGVFNTAINVIKDLTILQTYPNPARDTLFFEFNEFIETLELADFSGKTYFIHLADDQSTPIHHIAIQHLPQGIYSLKINNTAFAKFVKE
jgi:hypothetical protein